MTTTPEPVSPAPDTEARALVEAVHAAIQIDALTAAARRRSGETPGWLDTTVSEDLEAALLDSVVERVQPLLNESAEREAGLRTDLDQARRERDEAQRQEAAWRASAQESDKGLTLYAREVRRLRAELAGARTIPDDAAERLARLLYAATRTDARLPAEIPDNWVGEHGHVLVERGYDKTWIDYARKVLTDLGLSTTRTPPAPAATVVQWLPATYVNTAGGGGCANCNGYQPLGHEGKCYPYGQGPTPDRLPPNTRFVFSPSATAEPTATGNLHDADVTEDPNEPGRYIATCPACHVSITGAESVVEDAADQHFSEAALGVGYQALTTEPDDEWENRHDPAEDIGCTNPPAVSCSDAGCPRHGHDTEEGDTDE